MIISQRIKNVKTISKIFILFCGIFNAFLTFQYIRAIFFRIVKRLVPRLFRLALCRRALEAVLIRDDVQCLEEGVGSHACREIKVEG